ncbi:hypothetical protein CC78DRAFT_158248 [Lojkania enalia]|uniref:Uncharacterized protein n=1 Tax=Lojkania enalia TaxID=147567 RepID=A0A9P4JW14_9PLEO|nr:hypothetical protein CC78DRAFT_158248 [Didymosphaeria enalia]
MLKKPVSIEYAFHSLPTSRPLKTISLSTGSTSTSRKIFSRYNFALVFSNIYSSRCGDFLSVSSSNFVIRRMQHALLKESHS